MHYAQQYSWEVFVEANVEVCRVLQSQTESPQVTSAEPHEEGLAVDARN
jgi:hypothetical protein